jgi:hypothetical protein
MRLSIEVERKDILAIARFLDLEDRGYGVAEEDCVRRDDVLIRLVCQASVAHGIKSAAVVRCVELDYARFEKAKKQWPAKRAKDQHL